MTLINYITSENINLKFIKKPVKTFSLQFAVAVDIIWRDEHDEVT